MIRELFNNCRLCALDALIVSQLNLFDSKEKLDLLGNVFVNALLFMFTSQKSGVLSYKSRK